MTEDDKRDDREDLIGCNICVGLIAAICLLAGFGVI
jgi:hypothetical protein